MEQQVIVAVVAALVVAVILATTKRSFTVMPRLFSRQRVDAESKRLHLAGISDTRDMLLDMVAITPGNGSPRLDRGRSCRRDMAGEALSAR